MVDFKHTLRVERTQALVGYALKPSEPEKSGETGVGIKSHQKNQFWEVKHRELWIYLNYESHD